jgi:hypothetical protein
MAEELPAAPERPEIVDPNNIPIVFTDWFITGGQNEGVINVALGAIDHSLNLPGAKFGRVVVTSRLRLTKEFAARLHKVLGDILGEQQDPEQHPGASPKTLN